MIELSHIYKTFQAGTVNESVLFSDFNLSIHDDDFIAVIGSNGSGKTTMLNLLCGSLSPDQGQIIRDGKDITKMKEYKRSQFISRVYQDPSKGSCPSFSILENIALADNKGKPFNVGFGIKRERLDYYRTMLETLKLGLENRLHDKVFLHIKMEDTVHPKFKALPNNAYGHRKAKTNQGNKERGQFNLCFLRIIQDMS